jgi:hypothetical protein
MKRIVYVVVLAASASSAALFSACTKDDDAVGGDSGTNNEASSSSSGSTSSSGGNSGDGGTLCAQYAEAVCNRTARCQPLLVDFAWGTVEVCRKGFEIACQRMTTAPGAATFSAACITPFETGCGDIVPDPNCAGSKGTLTENTPCEFDSQCTSGRCGSAGGTPGCGLCRPVSDASASGSRTPLGGSCNDEGRCEKGLSCADAASTGFEPGNGTCQTMRVIGESCQEVEDCNTGFYGDFGWTGFSVACINGICAKPLDEGATCPAGLNKRFPCDLRKKLLCQGATANDGSFTGTCTKMTFKNENEPCTQNSQTPSGDCRGDLLCNGDAGAGGGTCVPRPGNGEPSPKDYMCQFGLSYVDGKCTLAPADFCK